LALVASLKHQGLAGVRERLRAPLLAITGFAEALADAPDVEVCHIPDTGILCVRLVPEGLADERLDALQLRIYERMLASGERSVGITRVNGRAALRFVAVSPAVTTEALLESVAAARALAKGS
jgi:glutamate/tyrosine decarboxylase-like PLP-dependent enzyme